MTDIGLIILGCGVSGIAITATMVYVFEPSQAESSPKEKRELAAAGREVREQIREHNQRHAS